MLYSGYWTAFWLRWTSNLECFAVSLALKSCITHIQDNYYSVKWTVSFRRKHFLHTLVQPHAFTHSVPDYLMWKIKLFFQCNSGISSQKSPQLQGQDILTWKNLFFFVHLLRSRDYHWIPVMWLSLETKKCCYLTSRVWTSCQPNSNSICGIWN